MEAPRIAFYLQLLKNPEIYPRVSEAILNKDETSLDKLCVEAGIPNRFITGVKRIVLSYDPSQAWPPSWGW